MCCVCQPCRFQRLCGPFVRVVKSLRLGWVWVMWIPAVVVCAQKPQNHSKWGEISVHQHVTGTPWFGFDVVKGHHTNGAYRVAGVHHQGWEAWQRHSVSAGQRLEVGAFAADMLLHVGFDRWPAARQADPWVSLDARFSHFAAEAGTFTVDLGWHSQGGLARPLTWSSSWQPPNPTGLLGCPQFMWSEQGQWGVRWNPRPTWLEDLRLWRGWSSGLQVFVGGPRWVAEVGWSWSPVSDTSSHEEDRTRSMGKPGHVHPRQHGWRVARGRRGVVTFHHLAWRWEE